VAACNLMKENLPAFYAEAVVFWEIFFGGLQAGMPNLCSKTIISVLIPGLIFLKEWWVVLS